MAHWLDDDIKKNGHLFNTSLKLYCEKANRFFDIMNGKDDARTGTTGVVHGGDDPKLAELTSYAEWLEAWKHDLAKRGLTKAEQEAAFISHQTYHDVRLTCHGFVWFVKYYTMEGMPGHGCPIYPQHFSQDTLEVRDRTRISRALYVSDVYSFCRAHSRRCRAPLQEHSWRERRQAQPEHCRVPRRGPKRYAHATVARQQEQQWHCAALGR